MLVLVVRVLVLLMVLMLQWVLMLGRMWQLCTVVAPSHGETRGVIPVDHSTG